jgi:uncharacterized protein YhdP
MNTDIEPVVVDDPVPLSKNAAKPLDAKIRVAANKVAAHVDRLLTLMDQAATGQAHVALGFATPAAYFYDSVQIAPAGIAQQKLLAALIADRRLTPKVIAEAFK